MSAGEIAFGILKMIAISERGFSKDWGCGMINRFDAVIAIP